MLDIDHKLKEESQIQTNFESQKIDKGTVEAINQKRLSKSSPRRICCFTIKQQWSIKKQLLISLLVLSSIIFTFVIAIVFVNLFITKELLMNAQRDAIKLQVEKNLKTQASVYAQSVLEDIGNQAQNLDLFNKIILAALQEDETLYDFQLSYAFPVYGPDYGLNVFQSIPKNMLSQDNNLQSLYQNPITLQTWTYAAFKSIDKIELSNRGQQLYNATDVLNHILEDFYFNRKITFMDLIYIGFEQDGLTVFFPGGAVNFEQNTKYQPQQRPWFTSVQKQLSTLGTFGSPYNYDPIISNYIDAVTFKKVLTISLPIINKNNTFLGCSNIDVMTKDLEKFFRIENQSLNTYIFMTDQNGQIMNNPYTGESQIIFLNQTDITKIMPYTWIQIDKWAQIQADNKTLIAATNIFYDVDSDGNFILLVVSMSIQPKSRQQYQQYPRQILQNQQLCDQIMLEFEQTEINTIYTITVTILLAIITAYFFSYRIVKPLNDLTLYALQINQSIKNQRKGLARKSKNIDLDSIHAQDKIGELIEAFKNLIQGLAGLKKGSKRDAGSQKLIQFPVNQHISFGWEDQLNLLMDQDEYDRKNNQQKPDESKQLKNNRIKNDTNR